MKKLRSKFPYQTHLSLAKKSTWIGPYIRNYLYFMYFVESASELTLRSYKVDLEQAFGSFIRLQDVTESSSPTSRRAVERTPISNELEAELLEQARSAQRNWAVLSPASRNRKAATLKSFFGWLHRESLLRRDLAAQIHGPKVPTRLPKHLSVDEAIALLRSCEKRQLDSAEAFSTHTLVSLLYGGGLRVSEACQLKFQDIDFDQLTCRIVGKGSKERVIALPVATVRALQQSRARNLNFQYVFGEKPLSPRVAYEWVRKAGISAELLRPLHPHALRHSYATHLLRSGANLRVLQALLGHSTLQATSRYTHIGLDQLARTLEAHHPLGEELKDKA
jgi:site-specific recombinase XerD